LPVFISLQLALAWRIFQYVDSSIIESAYFAGFAYE
jgi:AraC-like DNA-binding protein